MTERTCEWHIMARYKRTPTKEDELLSVFVVIFTVTVAGETFGKMIIVHFVSASHNISQTPRINVSCLYKRCL